MKDSLSFLKDSISKLINQQSIETSGNNGELLTSIGIILGIIGVIGTAYTVYGFYQEKKSNKLRDYIFEKAKINIEHEYNEQKLNETKDELNNIQFKFNEVKDQIKKDLPIEAKKVVLKDKLDVTYENLMRFYNDVLRIKSQLDELGEESKVSNEILDSIKAEVEPQYFIREKISNAQSYLTVTSTLAGIIFIILPHPMDNLIGIPVLLLGVPFLYRIIKNTGIRKKTFKTKISKNKVKIILIPLLYIFSIILSFGTFLVTMALFILVNDKIPHSLYLIPILSLVSGIISLREAKKEKIL